MTQGKWYHPGVAFSCQGCGNCCSGPEEGYVWINTREIKAVATFLKLSVDELKRKYLRKVRLRFSLIEKQPGKDCVFLARDSRGGKSCEIYSLRPQQCRTWPFWAENIRSRDTWQQAGRKCPGIGRGLWYDTETIDSIHNGEVNAQPRPITIEQAARQWISANRRNKECLAAVAQLYKTIDNHLAAVNPTCDNCGACCDFAAYNHRLYVTTLEMLYLWHGADKASDSRRKIKKIEGKCPYQRKEGCTTRDYRPAGCRIFFCRDLDRHLQNELTENVLKRLKTMHQQFAAVYYYANLLDWLKITPHHQKS